MTNREMLLNVTAALRNLATALELDVQTEGEALMIGAFLQPAVTQLAYEVERILDLVENERRNRALRCEAVIVVCGDADDPSKPSRT